MNSISVDRTNRSWNRPRASLLVVCGDILACKRYGAVLQAVGYQVATVENGTDALLHLAAIKADLVVADMQTSKSDNESLVHAIRNSGIRIPVIRISGPFAQTQLPSDVTREVDAAILRSLGTFELLSAIVRALKPATRTEAAFIPARWTVTLRDQIGADARFRSDRCPAT